LVTLNILVTLVDAGWLLDLLSLMHGTTLEFRLSILLIAFVNGVITFLYEKIAVWYFAIWYRNRKEKQRMKEVED
jgi:hypothetical protein